MKLFCFDHVTLIVHTTKMGLVGDTDRFGNHLKEILEGLEEGHELEQALCDIANKANVL